jgi:hypothetical protein
MKSFATPKFWEAHAELPDHTRKSARKQELLWLSDPKHPSLRFKNVGELWLVRVTQGYRALALLEGGLYH